MTTFLLRNPHPLSEKYAVFEEFEAWFLLEPALKQRLARIYRRYQHWRARQLYFFDLMQYGLWEENYPRVHHLMLRAERNRLAALDEIVTAFNQAQKEVEGL